MVSVVLVTYNRAERLKLSIQDILDQSFRQFELLICDDYSGDHTKEVCEHFQGTDRRIKYIRHNNNKGMPANLNFGIQQAAYGYIAILHDGDRFKPTLLQKWYDAISQDESIGLVFNSIGVTDENDTVINYSREFNTGILERKHLLRQVFFRRWLLGSPVYGEVMIKKKIVEENGYFKLKYGFYADVDMWMSVLHRYHVFYYEETLITGPLKSIQPRLFKNTVIMTFIYMYEMHLCHIKIEYKKSTALIFELIRFRFISLVSLTYFLLIFCKNQNFMAYFEAGKLLAKKQLYFILPWIMVFILSPFIKIYKLYQTEFHFRPRPTGSSGRAM